MVNNKTIDLEEEFKRLIVQGVQNGLDRYREYKIENKTITNLGSIGTKWDKINTECSYALPKNKFDVVACKRGVWELILIYDKETKNLFTLMKEQRFETLLKSISVNKVHYLEALTMCNINDTEEYIEQTTFFNELTEDKKEKIEKTLEVMLKKIDGEIEKHVLIRFNDREFELSSITASIITPYLTIIMQENWSEYIQPKYDIVINNTNELEAEDEDISLTLKSDTSGKFEDVKVKINKKKRNNTI